MKQKFKNTKGITLVALIITIIVLLILAVVAITSISNSNILNHAKNGSENYKQSQNNEARILAEYGDYLDENNSGAFKIEGTFFYFYKHEVSTWTLKNGILTENIYNRDGTINMTNEDYYKVEDDMLTRGDGSACQIKYKTIGGKTCISLTTTDGDEEHENEEFYIFESLPSVREGLSEKRYGYKENESDESLKYAFTVKIYNINGQKVMSFYNNDNGEDNFFILDENTIYELPDSHLELYGKINDDDTIDENDNNSVKGYTRYYVMENN